MWEAILGDVRPVELACFDQVIDSLRDRMPRLLVRVHPKLARATIPVQNGLNFEIHIALTNRDELHLRADRFKCRWVACAEPGVTDEFVDALCGLITGRYRIVLTTRLGRIIGGKLQKPVDGYWKTIARQGPQHHRFTLLTRSRVMFNHAEKREVLSKPTRRKRRKSRRTRATTTRPTSSLSAGAAPR